ncbi:protein STRUBBELIG-RECEPTOR FAMILY 6-like isoform X1 [Iris pallida]|uniref:Protein STRUBBELIG-RECEPTOR FAMILY 6-like isoform X1 n=1 Tax=Iris pallida TaxID=29817 RepID=A0AAX6EDL8_IRIPA|nr:protein STRUBBELIG-RECEPTOR FAMILY 6-like isoform X1 [Iris pallida]
MLSLMNPYNSSNPITFKNDMLVPCCGQSWKAAIFFASSVTAIKLSGLGLTRTLGYNMNIMTSLVVL